MPKPTQPKREEKGLCFPPGAKGDRSTSDAGKKIIAAALRGAKTPQAEEFATKCEKEKSWRFKYHRHFMNLVKVSASSPDAALGSAIAGSEFMHQNFEFIDPTTKAVTSFSDYMKNASSAGGFHTHIIEGGKPDSGGSPVTVNYKGAQLSGEALKKQLNAWAAYGTIEPDAALSIGNLANGKLSLKDKVYVLIGAGSAMGPYAKLLEHGATVVCIDIPGAWGDRPADMWRRLIRIARDSPGRIVLPVSKPSISNDDELLQAVGCNLTEQPAQILNWLKTVTPGKALTVGNYTYLDGDLHVKLSLAADAVIKHLCEQRKDVGVAFLCTPTDIHCVPAAATAAARANYGLHPGKLLESMINLLSLGKMLRKNALPPVQPSDGSAAIWLVDGLSVAQGPNYALAKRLQHWRAMIAYENGNTVSSNIAPSTATLSVVSNRSFGWAYGGMPYFKPFEIFQQETTNGLMGALLIADTQQPDSVAHPANRSKYGIANTMELFKFNSMHGGVWRAAYKVDSIGETSVLIHFLGGPKLFLPIVYAATIALLLGILKLQGIF